MDLEKALEIIIREGTAIDGLVCEARLGIDSGEDRVKQLLQALRVVAAALATDTHLDRKLANALYGLSFHLDASISRWKHCSWIDHYTEILSEIESLFEGADEPSP